MTTAVILAGGLGSRLREVVSGVPKPMAPISGRPFLEFQFDYCIERGVDRFVLSLGYLHQIVMDHFGTSYRSIPIEYSIEDIPLGTGGGLLLASRLIENEEAFFLLNGDTFFPVNLGELSRFGQTNNADWCIALFRTVERGRYTAIDISPNGRITSLGTEQARDSEFLANGGAYWIRRQSLIACGFKPGDKCSLESMILPKELAAEKRLFGLAFRSTFLDIGVPSDYERAASVLAR